jgi:hypothetical protein
LKSEAKKPAAPEVGLVATGGLEAASTGVMGSGIDGSPRLVQVEPCTRALSCQKLSATLNIPVYPQILALKIGKRLAASPMWSMKWVHSTSRR